MWCYYNSCLVAYFTHGGHFIHQKNLTTSSVLKQECKTCVAWKRQFHWIFPLRCCHWTSRCEDGSLQGSTSQWRDLNDPAWPMLLLPTPAIIWGHTAPRKASKNHSKQLLLGRQVFCWGYSQVEAFKAIKMEIFGLHQDSIKNNGWADGSGADSGHL